MVIRGKISGMKAQVFGVLASIVFLFSFAFIFRSEPPARRAPTIKYIPVPVDECPKTEQPKSPPDTNEKFRLVPANFMNVDFNNLSFGPYRFSSGRVVDLTLKRGDYEYNQNGERGWFHMRDTYYADVTGDDAPEAIIWIWHVQCDVSCDGSSLFYVYTVSEHGLQRIWEYETGRYAYACGLKTITVMNKQISVQLFGRCGQDTPEVYGGPIFRVADRSILNFRFNGKRFVKGATDFISSPPRDLENYEPQMYIIQ